MFSNSQKTAPDLVKNANLKIDVSGASFKLHNVDGPLPLSIEKASIKECVNSLALSKTELIDSFCHIDLLPSSFNPLIHSIYLAYSTHRSLALRPDDVWLAILQGLAQHISENPETYRGELCAHEGVKAISIESGALTVEAVNWPLLASAFSDELANQPSKLNSDWVRRCFTTTDEASKIAFDMALMDILQPFYDFYADCICGIPQVTLRGTRDDWAQIQSGIDQLDDYGLDWWTPSLRHILGLIVSVFDGKVDLEQWNSIVSSREGYVEVGIDGWAIELIPYLYNNQYDRKMRKNPLVINRLSNSKAQPEPKAKPIRKSFFASLTEKIFGTREKTIKPLPPTVKLSTIPKGMSRVPVYITLPEDSTTTVDLLSGFVGVNENEDNSLSPQIGWAVCQVESMTALIAHLNKHNLCRPPLDLPTSILGEHLGKTFNYLIAYRVPAVFFELYSAINGATITDRTGDKIGYIHSLGQFFTVTYRAGEFKINGTPNIPYEEKLECARHNALICPSFPDEHPTFGHLCWFVFANVHNRYVAVDADDDLDKTPAVYTFELNDQSEPINIHQTESTLSQYLLDQITRQLE